jgi:hypothetical protein
VKRRHRLLRWLRVKAHTLHLLLQGHTRAAGLMRDWKPIDHSSATIKAGKANLIRRYGRNAPGRR